MENKIDDSIGGTGICIQSNALLTNGSKQAMEKFLYMYDSETDQCPVI